LKGVEIIRRREARPVGEIAGKEGNFAGREVLTSNKGKNGTCSSPGSLNRMSRSKI